MPPAQAAQHGVALEDVSLNELGLQSIQEMEPSAPFGLPQRDSRRCVDTHLAKLDSLKQ